MSPRLSATHTVWLRADAPAPQKSRRFALFCATALSGAFAAAGPAMAQTVIDNDITETVDGAGGGTQQSPWEPSDELRIGETGTGTLIVRNGGEVRNGTGVIGQNAGSEGTVTITGAGSEWVNLNDLRVGNAGNGTLTVENGGVVFNALGYIGADETATGTVTVTGAGSQWLNSTDLRVGNDGTGTLTVSDGAAVSNVNGLIGATATGMGTVTVTGAGSTWDNSQQLSVGNGGNGTLTVENGGMVSSQIGTIGRFQGATGTVTVAGAGSQWVNSDDLRVGSQGNGTLTVEDGGEVSNTIGIIAGAADSIGTATVTGAGSRWDNSQQLSVGDVGTGTLTVENGGIVSSLIGTIGRSQSATGTATVTGAGSEWVNLGDLRVGDEGNGTLTVEGGGAVSNALGIIGGNATGQGTATVSGAGSTWDNGQSLFIGDGGTGTLTVENGGAVSNTGGFIATTADSIGTATVSGAGSSWTSTNELRVGDSGNGTLTIANGGTVRVVPDALPSSFVVIARNATSTGVLNIGAGAGETAAGAGTLEATVVEFGDGAGALVFNHTDTDYAFAPDVTGAGAVDHYAGVTTVTGALTHTGGTTIHGGEMIVNGSIGNQTDAGDLTVGTSAGAAALTVRDGGTVRSMTGDIGGAAGSAGTVTVSGVGSQWINSGVITQVGGSGTGTLAIEDGAEVSNDAAVVGATATGMGTVTVSGAGSTWTNSQNLFIGDSGGGRMTVSNGGKVSSFFGAIGVNTGATGTATVAGAGSTWEDLTDLRVGIEGTGTLTVTDGGTVRTPGGSLTIAQNAGSTGVVNIGAGAGETAAGAGTLEATTVEFGDGAGTLVFNHTDTDYAFAPDVVGDGAVDHRAGVTTVTGALTHTGGTTIHGGEMIVAGVIGDQTDTGELTVGASVGTAALTIQDGGLARSTTGTLGALSGETGTATVAGAGSRWESEGGLSVGGSGAGTLTVADDGTVRVGAVNDPPGVLTVADGAGSTGVVNIGAGAGETATGAGTLEVSTVQFGDGAGTLVFNHTDTDYTFTPNVSGAGAVEHYAGVTKLDHSLTHTGGTTIHGGEMVVAGVMLGDQTDAGDLIVGASAGTAALTVQDNSMVRSTTGVIGALSDATGAVTVAGANAEWDNTGSLVVGGGGTADLTIADDGSVSVGSSDALTIARDAGSRGSVNIGANAGDQAAAGGALNVPTVEFGEGEGTLIFNHTDTDYTFGADVSGAGQINHVAGQTTFAGVVDNAGETAIAGGDVTVAGEMIVSGMLNVWDSNHFRVGASGETGALTVTDGGTTSIEDGAGTLTVARDAGTAGAVNIGADADAAAAAAGTLDVATVEFGDGEGTLVFNHTDANYIFTPNASGAGAVGHYAGVTTVTGDLAHTGGTTIHGGEMIVNGSIGAVDILAGALSGGGQIGRLNVGDGGVLAPGGSIGTMTVNGDVVFESGSTLEVEIDNTGQSDLLAATGAATIETGAVLNVLPENGTDDGSTYNESTSYTILTADGGLTGAFDTVTEEFAFLDAEVVYGANDATLILNRNEVPFANVGVTRNQIAAASGIESLGSGAAVYDVVVGLGADDARRAYDALSGEIHASVSGLMVEDARYAREAALTRARKSAGGGGSNTDESADDSVAVWGEFYAARGEWDGDGNAETLERGGGGIFVGADIALPWTFPWMRDARVGLMGGFSRSDMDVDARLSSADVDSYHFGAYGGGRTGSVDWRVGLTHAWHDVETKRSVIIEGFNAFTDAPRAAYDANLTQFFAEVGSSITVKGATFEPYAGLAYVDLNTDGFTETGGAARLSAEDAGTNTIYTTLGARGAHDVALAGVEARLEGGLAWRHAFDDTAGRADLAFDAGGEAFTLTGVPIAQDAALVDFGVGFPIAGKRGAVAVSYVGQFSGDVADNGVRARIGFRF